MRRSPRLSSLAGCPFFTRSLSLPPASFSPSPLTPWLPPFFLLLIPSSSFSPFNLSLRARSQRPFSSSLVLLLLSSPPLSHSFSRALLSIYISPSLRLITHTPSSSILPPSTTFPPRISRSFDPESISVCATTPAAPAAASLSSASGVQRRRLLPRIRENQSDIRIWTYFFSPFHYRRSPSWISLSQWR